MAIKQSNSEISPSEPNEEQTGGWSHDGKADLHCSESVVSLPSVSLQGELHCRDDSEPIGTVCPSLMLEVLFSWYARISSAVCASEG